MTNTNSYNPFSTAPKDGRKFWAYYLNNGPRRLVYWNNKDIPAMYDGRDKDPVEPELKIGWVAADSGEVNENLPDFDFWSLEDGLNYREPYPNGNPFVPSLDQEVLCRLAYKLQEAGYLGSYIFECLVPEGNTVYMEQALDKVVHYMTVETLPKLDPSKPWEKF